jgi:hypothetical protein
MNFFITLKSKKTLFYGQSVQLDPDIEQLPHES